ncbi:hypothetical protein [Acidovorax sp. ACV01]|uniref:hypothetical protein n=1 Tax=Acidovorax sp. ACV01 TaxID=2769311 RepID=UPI00177D2FDB|nr:hypothetical protein [Acidovorax sp. ACV01]MBD9392195.1 hypothetical protein [Acidovorax sp. ACV01]
MTLFTFFFLGEVFDAGVSLLIGRFACVELVPVSIPSAMLAASKARMPWRRMWTGVWGGEALICIMGFQFEAIE